MKKIFVLVVLQLLAIYSFAQDTTIVKTDSVKIYSEEEVDQIATFIGGNKNFQAFLKQKGKRPIRPGSEDASGYVVVSFMVDEKGQVSDIKIIKSVRGDYDNAAIQIYKKSSGYWIPATKNGEKVKSYTKSAILF